MGVMLALGVSGCGTYKELSADARSVSATTSRPAGKCETLRTLTGKGGGATGAYVSNEELIEYAVNDLRNQAAAVGATHVVYSTPSLGGNQGTTTSAMVMGEAMRCEDNASPAAPAVAVEPAPAPKVAAASGCEYDTQCKGERVCVNKQCVDPAPPPSVASATAEAAAPAAVAPPVAPAKPATESAATKRP